MDAELLALLRDRPGMLGAAATWEARVAYLYGYDHALSGSALDGFREFLLMRTGGPNNFGWDSLVRVAAGDSRMNAVATGPVPSDREPRLVEALFEVLDEFVTLRLREEGRAILWEAWGRHRAGLSGEAWIGDRRREDCMTVSEAVSALGTDRRHVLQLARHRTPHSTLPAPVKVAAVHVDGIASGELMLRADDIATRATYRSPSGEVTLNP